MKNILGISAYYHDSAAALISNGRIVAAAQEERFSRKKHDPGFPAMALEYCLSSSNFTLNDIDTVIFYDKPLLKFERLLETYLAHSPRGFSSFLKAMPVWLKEKLYLKILLRNELSALQDGDKQNLPVLLFSEHHKSHAASAFYPSPFQKAAVICMDGVGEWATTSVWKGEGNSLTPLWQIDFPHSLGLLYSAFTYYCGFKVNSGEYKLMGLAPYGEARYRDTIMDQLVDIKADGSFRLNMDYFDYATGLKMTNDEFDQLFSGPARKPESPVTQREMDLAASIQSVTEDIVLALANTVRKETACENLCLAGGVALNCVANGKLLQSNIFEEIWIQPAAGDAGGAIGSALTAWHEYYGMERKVKKPDAMQGSYLGPAYTNSEIKIFLDSVAAIFEEENDDVLYETIAKLLAEEKIVGWFQGRMEFGPRALGGRSILGDPRSKKMQSVMNLKIKYRESFRPFAPSVLEENIGDYFELEKYSPYMLLVADVNEDRRLQMTEEEQNKFGIEKLNNPRSIIPAVTHVDYSARIQSVSEATNPRYYQLIKQFDALTACPLLVNTSFNVRGEPLVCSPEDAYRCFMRTEMDYLVLENCILSKDNQPEIARDDKWKNEFELD
ncbi:MAG: hypothetical protein GKR93_17310 [Gammaproteobacteria bacterium]|nr:hypothetical protein [Gammaproteobacteria bacterium]